MPLANAGSAYSFTSAHPADYASLVLCVQKGGAGGLLELYRLMHGSVRAYFGRRVGFGEADDLFAEAFLAVVQAIQRGGLRQPECLMGLIATVLRRKVAAHVNAAVRSRRRREDLRLFLSSNRMEVEDDLLRREKAELLVAVLRSLRHKDREVLRRFYLLEETKEQICAEMGLTDTQFRLLKSRAKTRLHEKMQRRNGDSERLRQRPAGPQLQDLP